MKHNAFAHFGHCVGADFLEKQARESVFFGLCFLDTVFDRFWAADGGFWALLGDTGGLKQLTPIECQQRRWHSERFKRSNQDS